MAQMNPASSRPSAAAALGRELAGFIWAIGRMVRPHPIKPGVVQA